MIKRLFGLLFGIAAKKQTEVASTPAVERTGFLKKNLYLTLNEIERNYRLKKISKEEYETRKAQYEKMLLQISYAEKLEPVRVNLKDPYMNTVEYDFLSQKSGKIT